jgi:hypothetical protein
MRRLRHERASVDEIRVLAWLGLLATALALAGCATFAADRTYASGSPITAEGADLVDDRAPVQNGLSSFFSRIYGFGPMLAMPSASSRRLSPAEEEALIERAIAEHEMRKP